jgi:hypothetical protein
MKHRKLRIAWSVAWGLLAVLLCVLWVRSIWYSDFIYKSSATEVFGFVVGPGMLKLERAEGQNLVKAFGPSGWHWKTSYTSPRRSDLFRTLLQWFNFQRHLITIPFWFLLLLFAALARLPWKKRFSLHTLLVTTTLVASVLGMAAWAARK